MNKDELVGKVASETGLTQADADRAIKALATAIRGAVAGGAKVQIPGLGTFEPRERSARTGAQILRNFIELPETAAC